LFKGPRPTITFSPASVRYGQQFNIITPQASTIRRVALIRPSATTHANQMDDKYYIDLNFTVSASRTGLGMIVSATAPSTPEIAVPGYYMLAIVNENGVPAVMPFIQLDLAAAKKAKK